MNKMMRVVILFLGSVLTQCTYSSEITDSVPKVFHYRNISTLELGIGPREVALTVDDGPGPRTLELARWLAAHDVPATFFMVGNEVGKRKGVMEELSSLTLSDGSLAFILANHSMTHDQSSLGTAYVPEVDKADKAIAPYVKTEFFFRPPYGNMLTETWLKQKVGETDSQFKARREKARIADKARVDKVNASGNLKKYIGPVLWNVGTSMENNYSADWECWTQQGAAHQKVKRCIDGYMREIEDKKSSGAVVLAHDIHSLTVDMLMGTGAAAGRSLILELRNRGYTFVALNKDKEKVKKLQTEILDFPGTSLSIFPFEKNDGQKFFDVTLPEKSLLKVTLGTQKVFETVGAHTVSIPFSVFEHFVSNEPQVFTFTAYKDSTMIASVAFPISLESHSH